MAAHQAQADPPSVLLAEHEPEVAEMSARYLSRDGLRVRLVSHPDQTLAELTAGPDVAAVIDLTMPGLDLRRIRRALRTPVIFLVADLKHPRPRGLATRGDVAGARRWLARPFGPRQLVALVRDVLAQPAASGPAPAMRSTAGLRLDGQSRTLVSRRSSSVADRYRVRAAGRSDGPSRPGAIPAPAAGRGGPPGRWRPGRGRVHRPAQGQDPRDRGDPDGPRFRLRA